MAAPSAGLQECAGAYLVVASSPGHQRQSERSSAFTLLEREPAVEHPEAGLGVRGDGLDGVPLGAQAGEAA